MADFRVQKKFATREPFIRVDPGLPVGRYRFQLTVVDSDGRRSEPALVNVEIVDRLTAPDPRLVDPITREPVFPVTPIIRP